MSLKIGRLGEDISIDLAAFKRLDLARAYFTNPISGGKFTSGLSSINVPRFSVLGRLFNTNATTSKYLRQQVEELLLNPAISDVFLKYTDDTYRNGFYRLPGLSQEVRPGGLETGNYAFSMMLERLGKEPSHLRATQFNKLARTTDYSGITAQCIHALPYGASGYFASGSNYTRAGEDGAIPVVKDATNRDLFLYELAEADINQGDVIVWDKAGSEVAANWVEVLGPDHQFVGEIVIRNGLIHLNIDPESGTRKGAIRLAVYTGSSYAGAAQVYYYDLTNAISYANILPKISLEKVSPEEVIMTLLYPYQANTPRVTIKVQRGRWDAVCKVDFITGSAPANFQIYFEIDAFIKRYAEADAVYDADGAGDGDYAAAMTTKNFFSSYDTSTTFHKGIALVDKTGITPKYTVASDKISMLKVQVADYYHSIFGVQWGNANIDDPADLGAQLLHDASSFPKVVER